MSADPFQLLRSRQAELTQRLVAAITVLNDIQTGTEVCDTVVTTYLESILCTLYLRRHSVDPTAQRMRALLHCLIARSYLVIHHNPGLWEIHQREARKLLDEADPVWRTVATQSQVEAYKNPLPRSFHGSTTPTQ